MGTLARNRLIGFQNKTDQISFNPLTTNVPHHVETSEVICTANRLNGFYMIDIIGR